MDDIEKKGKRYAILTNVGLVPGGRRAGGRGHRRLPAGAEAEREAKTAFIFTPTATPDGAGGAVTVRF